MLSLLVTALLGGGYSAAPGLPIVDEAASIGRAQSLAFVGTPVTCLNVAGIVTCTFTGGAAYDTIQDEGVPRTQRTTVNFTGAGVSCVDSGGITVCTISGGAGGGNFLTANVDFGAGGTTSKTVSVAATWATTSSIIWCNPTGVVSTGRTEGAEDAIIEGLQCQISNRSAGVGFTLKCSPSKGKAYGIFVVHCSGGEP